MADQHSQEGSSTSNVSGEGSDSIVVVNVKTLDSHIYSFQVEKDILVSLFKEKIANEIGVPIGQQRLIFRGKVLKDDHLLSEYHVENGHTLHLVERQPVQSQPPSDAGSGESNRSNGNDATADAPRNRVGQISHSVVLGTFNVGEQGEGVVPDLSRVIGAVLNSFGIGSQTPANGMSGPQASTVPNAPGQAPQANETGGLRGIVDGQSQAGNQTQPGPAFPGQPFQLSPHVLQIPLAAAAAVPVPSVHVPIPDSLHTLSEFMNRMEQALLRNGYQPNTSSGTTDFPRVELPSDARGLPTTEALSIVLRQAQRLLSDHAISALSHIAGRLEQEGSSSDANTRGQIQTESVQVGLAVQHLGALLLELGRTMLTLRMGQSPAESSVNAGPAVYISQSGPNPIMVQPFPLQTSSLFGGTVPPLNPMTSGPVGIGTAPRHINIHIHAGTALAPVVSAAGARGNNGDGSHGGRSHGASSGGSGAGRVLPVRNVVAATVPSRPSSAAISSLAQPGLGVSASQPSADSVSLSSHLAEVTSRLRNFVGNMQEGSHVPSGQADPVLQASHGGSSSQNDAVSNPPNSVVVNEAVEPRGSDSMVPENTASNNEDAQRGLSSNALSSCSMGGSLSCLMGDPAVKSEIASEHAPSSSERPDVPQGAKAVPLGLGLGSLELKRRSRQPISLNKGGNGGPSAASLDQNLNSGISGQQLLQSLASRASAVNKTDVDNPVDHVSSAGRTMDSGSLGGQGSDGHFDPASAMSQVLHSPALNGLLAGVSEQTGVGSPDLFRNMLQQLTQSPQVMNTVNQIAQQVDGQDLGSMFSGSGGQSGGIDLSRMVQQMLPVVSQVLGRGSSVPPPFPAVEPENQLSHNERSFNGANGPSDLNFQTDLQQVARQIEQFDPPAAVFGSMVESAVQLNESQDGLESLVNELCGNEGLASEYMEMLRRDVQDRFQDGQDKC